MAVYMERVTLDCDLNVLFSSACNVNEDDKGICLFKDVHGTV